MDIHEINEILNSFKYADSNKLVEFVNKVPKIKSALYGIKKAHRGFELYGKKAKVKEDTNWKYAGHTLEIVEVVVVYNEQCGLYKKGSMDLRLNLIGTVFEHKENVNNPDKPYRKTSTVINTKDLILII